MNIQLDEPCLLAAYDGRPDLQGAIRNAAAAGPQYVELFNHISTYIVSRISTKGHSDVEQALKKRKLYGAHAATDHGSGNDNNRGRGASAADEVLLEIRDVSVVIPQRKKFTLCFTDRYLYARLPDSSEPVAGTSVEWTDIEFAFLLPVPEKVQKQHNILLFRRHSHRPPSKANPGTLATDPLVFTVPSSTAPKPGTISGREMAAASAVADDYLTLFTWAVTTRLAAAGNVIPLVQADDKLFASTQKQSHWPHEKAVWVQGFRGSKDGYLFFLPIGILWAFKKPLLFLPHAQMVSVSYTNVLSRTFNLNLELVDADGNGEEFEFSMLDQEDFTAIQAYMERHGLTDRSLASQRKAKLLNLNVVRGDDGQVLGPVVACELARAGLGDGDGPVGIGAGLDDDDNDDDDEGEDYDPGSEGGSEGSGSSGSSGSEDEGGAAGGSDEDDEE